MQLQNDELSIPARRLIALLKPLSSDDPKTTAALGILTNWNARVDADQPHPLCRKFGSAAILAKTTNAPCSTREQPMQWPRQAPDPMRQ